MKKDKKKKSKKKITKQHAESKVEYNGLSFQSDAERNEVLKRIYKNKNRDLHKPRKPRFS